MASFSSPWSLELALLLLEIPDGIDCVVPEELDSPAVDLLQAYRLHLQEYTLEPLLGQALRQLDDQLICGSVNIFVLFRGATGPYQSNYLFRECLCVLC